MKKLLFVRLLMYILLVLNAVACTHNPLLGQAEQLFETDYDSACSLLRSIDSKLLRSSADKALYALSVTRGRFYMGFPETNDSLISIATGYFGQRDPHRAALAWFYKAKTYSLTQQYNAQITALLTAQNYSLKAGNSRLLAYIYFDRATLFEHQGPADSAIANYTHSLQAFRAQHDTLNAVNTELQLASLYSRLQQHDTAEHICLRLLKNNQAMPLEFISTIYRMLGSTYHTRGDYPRATQVYKQTPSTLDQHYDDNLHYLIAKSFCANEQYDSARVYLENISDYRAMAPDYHKLYNKVYQHEANYFAAMTSLEKAMAATDSLYLHRIDESFVGLEKKYNYQHLQLENQKLEIKHFQTKLLVLICLICFAAVVILFYINWNKTKLKQLKADKELLRQKNIRYEREVENAKLVEHQLILHKIVITNLEQYRKNTHRKKEYIKEGFSPVYNDHFYHELYSAVDIEYNNLSKRIRVKYPHLNDNDILICCLLLAGFDTGMMASILKIKFDSMIVKRSRLRKKLHLVSSENLIEFLRKF